MGISMRRGTGAACGPVRQCDRDYLSAVAAASWLQYHKLEDCHTNHYRLSQQILEPNRRRQLPKSPPQPSSNSVASHHGKPQSPVHLTLVRLRLQKLTIRAASAHIVRPLQLPIPPPCGAPPHLHVRIRARHDAILARQEKRHGAYGLLLEVCARGRASESLREHLLRSHGCT